MFGARAIQRRREKEEELKVDCGVEITSIAKFNFPDLCFSELCCSITKLIIIQ